MASANSWGERPSKECEQVKFARIRKVFTLASLQTGSQAFLLDLPDELGVQGGAKGEACCFLFIYLALH